ncbi:hypothetical protein [Halobacillus seohaensis]|uniref:Replication protein n=1 Tax=Halobacillus seohaensis TaxID=447421 RepID=A0ABW2ESQ0_9BACI
MGNAKRLEEQQMWQDLNPKVKRGIMAVKENVTFEDGKATSANGTDVDHMVEVVSKTTDDQVRALKSVDTLTEHQIENGKFVFAFFEQARMMEERFPSLSAQDTARLMFIGTYVAWETNRLQSGKHIIRKKKLEEMVDMSTKRFNELFKRYKTEGILYEKESGEIFVNPTVFYRGSLKKHEYDITNLNYTRMFRKTVRDLYTMFKGRRLAQLAVIYSVLPFLNFNTNIICYNPEETDEELIRPMNLEKLAALLGYKDTYKLKRALDNIKIDGQPVFWVPQNVHDKRNRRIIANPRVVFGGDGESLKVIKALFN